MVANKLFLPNGTTVSTVLATNITISESQIIFNCTSILEISSTLSIQANIICLSTNSRSFFYDVIDYKEMIINVSVHLVIDTVYNVTWQTNSLRVKDIRYTKVTVNTAPVSTITIHPNESSTLLKLEKDIEYKVEVTVMDKCGQMYKGSIDVEAPTAGAATVLQKYTITILLIVASCMH